MKKLWEEISKSILQIYEMIEKENKSYIDLIMLNDNFAECSHKDLEKLV